LQKKVRLANPQPYHHGDLRRALIDTALELITEEQAWAFSLREVARRAGVSHQAPYNHFPEKQDLLSAVAIVGFDENDETLQGIKDGHIIGTVVQQPYEWGYQGMKLMAKYVGGDKSVIPADPIIIIPTKIIDKTNVDSFWAELKQRTGAK